MYLSVKNNQSVLTQQERDRLFHRGWGYHSVELRFVSYVGECGLLQYTQQVHVRDGGIFTSKSLRPHLHHFQSLERVRTLTIEYYDASSWVNDYKTCFIHFYPTLTSLTLSRPNSRYRSLLQFALQFPNLENLCLEWLPIKEGNIPDPVTHAMIDQSPPLRGHLRLAGYGTTSQWPMDFARELPNGFNFQSVELEAFFGDRVHPILEACENSVEDLTIVPLGTGTHWFLSPTVAGYLAYLPFTGDMQLQGLGLREIEALCRLTLRMTFHQVINFKRGIFVGVLSTITSPVFCVVVLEISKVPPRFDGSSSDHWGSWEEIDELLQNRFARYGSFRLLIRTGELRDPETFQMHAKEAFPLLANRGRVHFETSDLIVD